MDRPDSLVNSIYCTGRQNKSYLLGEPSQFQGLGRQKGVVPAQLLNFLNFKKVDTNKFPSIKIIKRLKNKETLLETIIVLANDELVNLFLLKKLNFTDINNCLQRLINMKKFVNLSQKKPGNISSIISLKDLVIREINKIIF